MIGSALPWLLFILMVAGLLLIVIVPIVTRFCSEVLSGNTLITGLGFEVITLISGVFFPTERSNEIVTLSTWSSGLILGWCLLVYAFFIIKIKREGNRFQEVALNFMKGAETGDCFPRLLEGERTQVSNWDVNQPQPPTGRAPVPRVRGTWRTALGWWFGCAPNDAGVAMLALVVGGVYDGIVFSFQTAEAFAFVKTVCIKDETCLPFVSQKGQTSSSRGPVYVSITNEDQTSGSIIKITCRMLGGLNIGTRFPGDIIAPLQTTVDMGTYIWRCSKFV